jgi:1-acyl-sn-glycerol-3-phosphate acyltransferase
MGSSSTGEKRTLIWRFLAFFVVGFLLAVAKYDMRHVERIPKSGPFVFAPNHYSNIDPLVSAYVLWKNRRIPRFLVKGSLFKVPVFGAILRATGQIPVQRTGGGRGSLAAAGKLADDGVAVVIYPEGTLTRDPELWPMRGKTGAVRAALDHDIPLIPMAHWGAQRILPRYSNKISLFPRKQVTAIIGEPVDLSPWKGRPIDSTVLAEATEQLMKAITALTEELRGEKAPLERWDPTDHGQAEIGKF